MRTKMMALAIAAAMSNPAQAARIISGSFTGLGGSTGVVQFSVPAKTTSRFLFRSSRPLNYIELFTVYDINYKVYVWTNPEKTAFEYDNGNGIEVGSYGRNGEGSQLLSVLVDHSYDDFYPFSQAPYGYFVRLDPRQSYGVISFQLLPGSSMQTVDYTVDYFRTVPEPAMWAMMIVGVGAIGGQLRRRRSKVRASVSWS